MRSPERVLDTTNMGGECCQWALYSVLRQPLPPSLPVVSKRKAHYILSEVSRAVKVHGPTVHWHLTTWRLRHKLRNDTHHDQLQLKVTVFCILYYVYYTYNIRVAAEWHLIFVQRQAIGKSYFTWLWTRTDIILEGDWFPCYLVRILSK